MEKQSSHGPESETTVSVPKTLLGSWRTTRREKSTNKPQQTLRPWTVFTKGWGEPYPGCVRAEMPVRDWCSPVVCPKLGPVWNLT